MSDNVRRDGLREAVTKLRDKWVADEGRTWISNCGDELSCVLDAMPDVPPTEDDWREANRYYEDDPGLLPDVPPDPPAADRDEVARWLLDYRYPKGFAWESITASQRDKFRQDADALLSSGRLVDAADVRARALDKAANDLAYLVNTPPLDASWYMVWLRDRAMSERDRTTT